MANTDLPRIDSAGVTLNSPAGATDTTLELDTATWTVDPTQYPMLVLVDGELVRAAGATIGGVVTLTNVTRAVNNVVKAHATGASVEVADPLRLTLGRSGSFSGSSGAALAAVPSQDGLVLWIDAAQDDTAANLADDQTYTAQLGSTAGADAEDPTITTNDGRAVWSPDGTADYIETDWAASITPTSGELTVIVIGVWDAADTAASFARLFSTETGNTNGFVINTGDPGDTEVSVALGGATTAVGAINTAPGFVDGQAFMVAGTYNAGDLRVYVPTDGLSAPVDASGVGTITHDTVSRVFHPANDTLADREATSDAQAVLIYERAITEAELDAIANLYGVLTPPPPQSGFYGGDYRPAAPSALRTVPTTTATFATNIANALPGDRIELASGSYGVWIVDIGDDLNGTAANPIVITPAAGATVDFTEIDIREHCSHLWLGTFFGESLHTDFTVNRSGGGGGGGACLRIGWDQQRPGTFAQNTVDNIKGVRGPHHQRQLQPVGDQGRGHRYRPDQLPVLARRGHRPLVRGARLHWAGQRVGQPLTQRAHPRAGLPVRERHRRCDRREDVEHPRGADPRQLHRDRRLRRHRSRIHQRRHWAHPAPVGPGSGPADQDPPQRRP